MSTSNSFINQGITIVKEAIDVSHKTKDKNKRYRAVPCLLELECTERSSTPTPPKRASYGIL
jgi:hypothetical protein